jgi:nitrite reductase/ring-hydroxylating ferredoxin subunit
VQRIRIANVSDLAEGQTIKFDFQGDGKNRHGFVARFEGNVVAYENVCRHIPISLDYGDNRFFSRDGTHLVCQNHGALYEPMSGLCVQGPCEGESLKALKIEVCKEEIWLLTEL